MDLTQRLTPLENLAQQLSTALAGIRERLTRLEVQTDALACLVGRDTEEAARIAKSLGIRLADLRRISREGTPGQPANRLFLELRKRGWSFDRIARATGYSARGVQGNLRRVSPIKPPLRA